MDTCDGTTDLGEHIENIDVVLNYNNVLRSVKCKLFMTTLRRGALACYKNLNRISIESWDELCHELIAKFSTSKTQLKTVVSLEAIV